ncbi:TMV resistance protein N-like [Vigna umbellata]|uniref:TMV resistance protein N-like n=1 Tax=Vigna umbellata TaxID=87088 RepID=UPI001F5EE147|nr:TMV resistance protein N-like [Vigna umbellata]
MAASSTYDVFLSFRRGYTGDSFVSNLYKSLCKRGIHTFKDDEMLLKRKESIATLLNAIEESRIAIVVLSHNYASSYFCLDELARILHCQTKGLLVIPVFYKVHPSDVRHQKGSYGEALTMNQKKFEDMEKVQKWKMALHQVANLSGYHIEDGVGYEYKFIKRIVDDVYDKITRDSFTHVSDYPIGLQSQVLEVRKLLDFGSEDGVHMIGIHGMGGIGKSILARAVYNDLIGENFDGLCFLENVREKTNKHGLKHLQSILLSQILEEKDINFTSTQQGISKIKYRLKMKKVLLVLDDVNKPDQLQAVAGGCDWFGPGSRIIITTRDNKLLENHRVTMTYEVKGLNDNDALQLLKWKAFRNEKADPDYELALNRLVTYASGLPLALEVIGGSLVGKSIEGWKTAIQQYEMIRKRDILNMLKVSFDALEEEEKSVFLNIAFFLEGHALTLVEYILHACYDRSMKHHIGMLVERSLLKFDYFDNRLKMHDLLRDMSRIVWKELQKEPGNNSRLWLHKDVIHVSNNNRIFESEINHLVFSISAIQRIVGSYANTFKRMKTPEKHDKKFQFLNHFLQSLRALIWFRISSNCLPSSLDNLLKKYETLTVMNFDECRILTQLPDQAY